MSGTYSFLDVAATLVGPTGEIDLGYGSSVAEEGIVIAPAGDKNTMMIGADGEGMHSLHADKSGTVTVKLLKTSPRNKLLQAMYDLQTATPTLHGKNVIAVRNPRVGDIAVCRDCAFKKIPNFENAKDGVPVEWVFDTIKIDVVRGTF